MTYTLLLNRAYVLALKLHQYAVLHDLPMMSEMELIGIINFMSRMEVN